MRNKIYNYPNNKKNATEKLVSASSQVSTFTFDDAMSQQQEKGKIAMGKTYATSHRCHSAS